jgi:CRP-like cAMP-binding protein
MSDDQAILDRLDRLIRLLSTIATKDLAQKEQIALLSKLGFQPKEIADFIGSTPHSVSVRLSELKKGKTGKPAKKPTRSRDGGK